jgi:transcriptional regulator with XRE-family HTH domain
MPTTIEDVTPFGASLRRWRRIRGSSQLSLAHAAGTTSRHLSFLETGRSRPSRDMVQRLARALDLPLRETNDLLRTAGLPSTFPESTLLDDDLAPFAKVIDKMLNGHDPYPAYAIDRRWNIVRANQAAQRFLPDGNGHNIVRLMFGGPWRDLITNWDDIAAAGAARVQKESLQHPDDHELAALADYATQQTQHLTDPTVSSSARVLCPTFRVGHSVVQTISVVAQFGGPRDVALEELRVELFFPADAASAQVLEQLARPTG